MTISDFCSLVDANSNFIITTHLSPDPDGLGAEIGLYYALRQKNKNVRIINSMPYSTKYSFMDPENCIEYISPETKSILLDSAWKIILLDTNDVNFIGPISEFIGTSMERLYIVDHHDITFDNSNLLILPDYSSTCEIIFEILQKLSIEPEPIGASALLTGIVYDTGSFAYSKTSIRTFDAASALFRYGANPTHIHSKLYESSDISVLLLKKLVLSTLELYHDNMISVLTLTQEALRSAKAEFEDANDIINLPLQSEVVQISVFFKQESKTNTRCSLRSKGIVNVASIAQDFGGGGHRNAAGFRTRESIRSIKEKIIKHIESLLENQ